MNPTAKLPPTLAAFILKASGRHQIALALLSIVVFVLSTAPLEIQRRIVNDAIGRGAGGAIVALAIAYAALALAEGLVKFFLNVYRSWVSEAIVRDLRKLIGGLSVNGASVEDRAMAEGIAISMVLSEADPIGGFAGVSVSEPVLQGGLLLSVFGYLTYLDPWMALLCAGVFSPQLVFVPLIQRSINRRAAERIRTLREVSGEIVASAGGGARGAVQEARVGHVFRVNMGIFKLKFGMNFLMNLMHHAGVAVALGVGGWQAVHGRIEVGTVVAFVSGLGKVNDPWGDVVNWFREMTAVRMRYGLVADAARRLSIDAGTG